MLARICLHWCLAFLFLLHMGAVAGAMCLPPPQGELGFYRFENGIAGTPAIALGSIGDSSMLAVHGDPFGSPIYSANAPTPGVMCGGNSLSLSFDGVDDSVLFASHFVFNAPASDGTLEFWLKAPEQGHRAILWTADVSQADSNRFHFFTEVGGAVGLDYRESDGTLHTLMAGDGTFLVPADLWTHVAVTRVVDSAIQHTYRFYRNGLLVHTSVDSNPNLPTDSSWTISGRPPPYAKFVGQIDEVRMSNAALLPAQFTIGVVPVSYCTAKRNSKGCVPSIGWTGTPSLACPNDDFHITVSNVLSNKFGILFLGSQEFGAPFLGGTLCVKPPLVRTGVQSSGGNPPPTDCSGSYSHHLTQAFMQQSLVQVGTTICAQYWSRDSGYAPPNNVGLTDALRVVIGP